RFTNLVLDGSTSYYDDIPDPDNLIMLKLINFNEIILNKLPKLSKLAILEFSSTEENENNKYVDIYCNILPPNLILLIVNSLVELHQDAFPKSLKRIIIEKHGRIMKESDLLVEGELSKKVEIVQSIGKNRQYLKWEHLISEDGIMIQYH